MCGWQYLKLNLCSFAGKQKLAAGGRVILQTCSAAALRGSLLLLRGGRKRCAMVALTFTLLLGLSNNSGPPRLNTQSYQLRFFALRNSVVFGCLKSWSAAKSLLTFWRSNSTQKISAPCNFTISVSFPFSNLHCICDAPEEQFQTFLDVF